MDTRSQLAQPKGQDATPGAARFGVLAAVGVLMLGALYLITVRGEALLVDLQNLTGIFCF